MKCFGCGVEKDPSKLEIYSHPETDRICTDPVLPLFVLECQPSKLMQPWKIAVVCHECFHKLNPDMWIGEQCWNSINPKTTFENLPLDNIKDYKWDPTKYQTLKD